MVNIIIRTSGRPQYFKTCMSSIDRQTYKQVNIIVGVDSNDTYADKYKPIKYPRLKGDKKMIQLYGYRTMHFPYNLYLNILMGYCEPGWVLILDDDNEFFGSNSLREIVGCLHKNTDAAFWRVRINQKMVPSTENFGMRPVVKDIDMAGFCFHSDYIPLLQFDSYKQADYRVADRIYSLLNPVWINKILTQTQRREGRGFGTRRDKQH